MNRVEQFGNKKRFYITDIIQSVAGNIYRMHSTHTPPNMDVLMSKFEDLLSKDCVPADAPRHSKTRYLHMTEKEFSKWLQSCLMSIKAFVNLNLSYREITEGVAVDDPSRPTVSFTSAYDIESEDSWKDDFIDLDACIRNIENEVFKRSEEVDCFLCDYQNTERCAECTLNPKFSNKYCHKNTPYGDHIMQWCEIGCPNGMAVCCKDCNKTENCLDVCKNVTKADTCKHLIVRDSDTNDD